MLMPPAPPSGGGIVLLLPHGWTWTTRPCGGSTRLELTPPNRPDALSSAASRRLAARLRDHLGDDPTDIAAALQQYQGSYASLTQYVLAALGGAAATVPAMDPVALGRHWLRHGWIWILADPGGGDLDQPPGVHVFRGAGNDPGRPHG
jgi:hypothetical protein